MTSTPGIRLIMANKAYSSWSVRPWLTCRAFDIDFEEVVIPLGLPDTRARILEFSPSGKCPALFHGELAIWDSLAIIEYLAEIYPDKAIWPADRRARALARSISAEMHSGFRALRQECPMNLRRPVRARALSSEALDDACRIEAIWARARGRFGADGPFLFGAFCAADAIFAPVASRLETYQVPISAQSRAYLDALAALPAWRRLVREAEEEPWFIDKYDAI